MKKQYEAPVVNSLRYVFAEGIAAPDLGDIDVNLSSLMTPEGKADLKLKHAKRALHLQRAFFCFLLLLFLRREE